MDIFVKTGCLEDLSDELRQIGSNIYEIESSYNTLIYEILNDTEGDENYDEEYKEELRTTAEKIKEFLDEGFLTVKKHETFIISAMEEYELIEREIVGSSEDIANGLYSGSSTYVAPGYKPTVDVLPHINPEVMPLIKDDLPKADLNRIDKGHERNPVKIVKLINDIVNGHEKRDDYLRALMGLIGLIAPGALISGMADVIPGFDPSDIIGLLNSDDNLDGGEGLGGGRSGYEDIVKLIGQGFQTNYNLIEAVYVSVILAELIKSGFNIGELGNYSTLSEITDYINRHNQDDGYKDNNSDEEPVEEEEEEKDSQEDVSDTEDNIYTSETAADTETEEAAKKRNNMDNIGLSETSYGEYEEEEANSKSYSSDLNSEPVSSGENDNLTEPVSEEIQDLADVEEAAEETSSVSGGGSSGSSGSSSGGSGSYSSSGSGLSSSLDTKDNSFTSSSAASAAESAVNYKSKNDNSNDIYSRILASIYGNEESAVSRRKAAAALAGTGAAALGGMGTFASIASNTASNSGAVLNQISGALSFNNLFEFVGNAQVCSLDWLSELTNILTTL